MGELKTCLLGDVIKFGNGKKRPLSEGNIPIYGGNGILGYCSESNHSGETIVIGRVGAYCGSVYYDETPIWVSDNALSAKSKPNNNLKYLYFLLKQMNLNQFAGGSSHPLVTHTLLNSLNIEIINNEDEQKAIATVLSSLDDKIELLYRQNKNLEAMAETLFRQWFVEEAEDDWKDAQLDTFIHVKHGYAFKGESITTEETNQILVTPGNFKIGGGFKFGKMKFYKKSNFPKEYIFNPDDLIVTMTDLSKGGDTLGYPALIPDHDQNEILYLHNQRVGLVNLKKSNIKYFIYFLMKTDDYQWFILGGASGTSVTHTSPTSICSYLFRQPPIHKIEVFNEIAGKFISKIHKNNRQIKTLEKLRDNLLPKLMSGEVRVKL